MSLVYKTGDKTTVFHWDLFPLLSFLFSPPTPPPQCHASIVLLVSVGRSVDWDLKVKRSEGWHKTSTDSNFWENITTKRWVKQDTTSWVNMQRRQTWSSEEKNSISRNRRPEDRRFLKKKCNSWESLVLWESDCQTATDWLCSSPGNQRTRGVCVNLNRCCECSVVDILKWQVLSGKM